MTRRSLELIATADAILYDRLIPAGALEGARADAHLRYVGKEPGDPAMEQEDINALLVELGTEGQNVVRLKGGDPFVFGRGGEEAEALAAAGVPFEVVPGVTAGVAAPAYAGIPVTAPRPGVGRRLRDGPRGPPQGRECPGLGRAGAFPGDARALHGGEEPPADCRAAGGSRPAGATEPAAVVERGTLPGPAHGDRHPRRHRRQRGRRGTDRRPRSP